MQTDTYRRRNAIYEALVADIAGRARTGPLSPADSAAIDEANEAVRGALLALCAEPAATMSEVQDRAVILADLLDAEHWAEYYGALARRIRDDLIRLSSANVTPMTGLKRAV